jgi:predicted branched-subunit amino acid permease
MFFDPANFRHPAFRQGMVDTLKVAPGIWAWGLMTGVAMVQAGLSPSMATLMTLVIYGGSAQLAAIPLLAAGAPVWVILATAFCVNLRFAVFSLHLRQYMMAWPRWQRLSIGYFIADLNYVQFVHAYPKPSENSDGHRSEMAYLSGNCFLNWIGWQIASLAGIVLAAQVPLQWGLGFAGVLALVGILCSLSQTRLRVVSLAVAGAAAVTAYGLPLRLNILVAIAASVAVCLVLEQTSLANKEAAS